jgi:hypothetical protein
VGLVVLMLVLAATMALPAFAGGNSADVPPDFAGGGGADNPPNGFGTVVSLDNTVGVDPEGATDCSGDPGS